MNIELRQWAIYQAIAAGAPCNMVIHVAAEFLGFVMDVAPPVDCAKRGKALQYEKALDAGQSPAFAANLLGVRPSNVSSAYTRIRRARGIPPIKPGNPSFARKNGAAHS